MKNTTDARKAFDKARANLNFVAQNAMFDETGYMASQAVVDAKDYLSTIKLWQEVTETDAKERPKSIDDLGELVTKQLQEQDLMKSFLGNAYDLSDDMCVIVGDMLGIDGLQVKKEMTETIENKEGN